MSLPHRCYIRHSRIIENLTWKFVILVIDRLRIKTLPTIALVKDAKTRDYIVGFSDLGNTDEFSTEMMEWRLAQADVIEYAGDLTTPPGQGVKSKIKTIKKKTIRGDDYDNDSDWRGKIKKVHCNVFWYFLFISSRTIPHRKACSSISFANSTDVTKATLHYSKSGISRA